MRLSSAAMLIVLLTLTASAQHRGGMGGGMSGGMGRGGAPSQPPSANGNTFPNQHAGFPSRVGPPTGVDSAGMHRPWGTGLQPAPCPFPSQGCHGTPHFWNAGAFNVFYSTPFASWNGWPGFGAPGFYNPFDPGYGGDPYSPFFYSQPPNGTFMPPPSYVAPAPIMTGNSVGMVPPRTTQEQLETQDPRSGEIAPDTGDRSTAVTSGLQIYQVPSPPTSTNDEHPTLIALKNHWAYTVMKYWVKGKTFHFVTTQGDDMQVPTALVERIYPTSNQSNRTQPKSTPAR